jgi:glycosyltransferase involved in cell wall biosynthesis
MKNKRIRIASISDSPKLHTGFGVVHERIAMGFHDHGIELYVLGLLDFAADYLHELPYQFTPITPLDELAHGTYGFFFNKIRPDIQFYLTDIGNLYHYMAGVINHGKSTHHRMGKEFVPPVIAYCPVEGPVLRKQHIDALKWVFQTGGVVVAYCNFGKQVIEEFCPNIDVRVAYHGMDHAPFRKYSDKVRKKLRQVAGIDDKFVIGSIGVNKLTKGFPEIMEVAKILRDRGKKDVIFYLHTNPSEARMSGYPLDEIVAWEGLQDYILFKPVVKQDNYWLGSPRVNDTLEEIMDMDVPDNPQERGYYFYHYGFIDKINCFDLYVDLSKIEGWGLPVGEAMACGVPAIIPKDGMVRQEVYKDGAYWIDPIPQRLWPRWPVGPRQVTVDPVDVADAIVYLCDHPKTREALGERGQQVVREYKWADTQAKFCGIAEELFEEFVYVPE